MIYLLAQTPPEPTGWGLNPGTNLILLLAGAFVVGMVLMFAVSRAPTRARRPIVWTFTFLAGGFFVLKYLWPEPIGKEDGQIPVGTVESVGFWIDDATSWVTDIAQILTAFLLGLGIYSLVRIHFNKFRKRQEDWGFSLVLLLSLLLMVVIGYVDWYQRQFIDLRRVYADPAEWGFFQKAGDLLFDGLIQQMDAAMFSMIAFFILSAAYRAFRIRSVEATVMMASALILMFSLMGAVDFLWSSGVDSIVTSMSGGQQNPEHFLNNFKLTEIAGWVKTYVQVPSIRALDFGVFIGALAMGLRIWLGLEKGGVSV